MSKQVLDDPRSMTRTGSDTVVPDGASPRSRGRRSILGMMLAAPGSIASIRTARAQSKTVYLLSWGGTIQTTFEKEGWAQKFKDATGYEVILVPKATTAEIMATAIAQRSRPQVDVVMCDYAGWVSGPRQDLFDTIARTELPNLANVAKNAVIEKDGKILGAHTYTDTIGLIYQKNMFEKKGWKKPEGWNDLYRPELAGKLALPPANNTYGMYLLVHLARANGGGEKNIDPGIQSLKKLAPAVLDWSTTFAQIGTLMQSESVALSVFGANSGYEIKRRGIPVEVVIPSPNYLSATSVGAMKGAPNPEGARVLMNWLLGKDFQQFRAERFGNNAMNTEVRVEGSAAERLLSREQVASLLSLDYETILEQRSKWNERFEREVAHVR
ncbi:MAG: extracellular solute-binding protein [Lautropia sp.]